MKKSIKPSTDVEKERKIILKNIKRSIGVGK